MAMREDGLNKDLLMAIQNALSRVSAHREVYQKNEEAVKQHLISEFFEALHWDWRNPDEVYPEDVTYTKARPDYALKVNNGRIAFVEVKNQNVDVLSDKKSLAQLAYYCTEEGVAYGILTNGIQWKVIKAFEEGRPVPERELFSIDLFKDSVGKSYLYLSLLDKRNITQLEDLTQKLKAFENIISELNSTFSHNELSLLLNSDFMRMSGDTIREISFPPENAIVLSQLPKPRGDNPPSKIYILAPNGKLRELIPERRKWRAILRTALRGLLELGIPDNDLEIPHYISVDRNKIKAQDKNVDRVTANNRTVYVFGAISSDRVVGLLRQLEQKSGVRFALEFK